MSASTSTPTSTDGRSVRPLLVGAGACSLLALAGVALDRGMAWIWGFGMPAFALVFLAALPGCSPRRVLDLESPGATVQVALLVGGAALGSAGYLLGATTVGRLGSVAFAAGVLLGAVSA